MGSDYPGHNHPTTQYFRKEFRACIAVLCFFVFYCSKYKRLSCIIIKASSSGM